MSPFFTLLLTCITLSLIAQDKKIGTDTKTVSGTVNIPLLTEDEPTIWMLAVGITSYSTEARRKGFHRLKSPAINAYKMKNLFERTGMVGRNNQVKILTDAEATKVSIKKAFDEVFTHNSQIKENDLLIFFYSGHGRYDKQSNQSYIIPYNYYEEDSDISEKYIKDKMNQTKAKHKVCFIEACRDAKDDNNPLNMGGGFAFSTEEKAKANKARTKVGAGWVYMTSTEVGGVSYDYSDGSIFSKYLLKGLEGAAQSTSNPDYITGNDLYWYVKLNVEKETKYLKEEQQKPKINENYLRDLPIIPLKNN